jgi:hypothetical protein
LETVPRAYVLPPKSSAGFPNDFSQYEIEVQSIIAGPKVLHAAFMEKAIALPSGASLKANTSPGPALFALTVIAVVLSLLMASADGSVSGVINTLRSTGTVTTKSK